MGNKKIKVCFFSLASYPFFTKAESSTFGGAELQMFLLANQVSKNKDFEITFLTGNFKQEKVQQHNNIKLIRSINMEANETVFSKLLKSFKYFFLLVKINPNIIITTTFNPIVGVTSLYKKIFKKKHIHRSANDLDVNMSRIKENGLSGKIFKYGLEHANTVLCQNNFQQTMLKKNHEIKAVMFKNVFRITEQNSYQKEHILWVGRLVDFKKPYLFIDLAKKIKNQSFIMVCPYHKKDYKEWNRLKHQAEQISNLTFVEKVPFDEIQDYFNRARLFVNTSDFEGFPNTFLQAAQAKTPIVSLNVNPDNFIDKYNCGIFGKNSFEKLVQETKDILTNEPELNIKGENCFKYLKENHDIELIGKQLDQIIHKLV